MLEPEVTDSECPAITLLMTRSIGFSSSVVDHSVLAPQVAAFDLLIDMVALFRQHGDRAPAATGARRSDDEELQDELRVRPASFC